VCSVIFSCCSEHGSIYFGAQDKSLRTPTTNRLGSARAAQHCGGLVQRAAMSLQKCHEARPKKPRANGESLARGQLGLPVYADYE
jgi:hypothetical protein